MASCFKDEGIATRTGLGIFLKSPERSGRSPHVPGRSERPLNQNRPPRPWIYTRIPRRLAVAETTAATGELSVSINT